MGTGDAEAASTMAIGLLLPSSVKASQLLFSFDNAVGSCG
jgi:hypothetical protein